MRIKQGTTMPYEYQIRDGDKTPIDLTSATSVVFTAIKDGETTSSISIECNFIDRTLGTISIPWPTGSTDTLGMYKVELTITWTGGKIEKVPSNKEEWLLILSSNTS